MPIPDVLDHVSLERAGARLHAFVTGPADAPPLVLLHGGLADHRAVWLYAGALAGFRVIAPDLRASGRSHFHGALSWELLADDVAALAAHLGLGRVTLGGASFGAGVATATALRHAGLVARLIVLAPAFAGAEAGLTPAQQQAMDAMDAVGQRVAAGGVHHLLPLYAALPPEVAARARAMAESFDPRSVAVTTAFLARGGQPFAAARDLAAITAPTLVVPGTDPTHPPEAVEPYRSIPRAIIRNCEQAAWGAAVLDFLTA